MSDPRLSSRALLDEIHEFHQLYTAWLHGSFEDEDRVLDEQWLPRCHPEFTLVMPGGAALPFDDMGPLFRESYGSNPDFATQVRDFARLHADGNSALVSFEEWHKNSLNTPTPNNARRSSVLFVLSPEGRLQWRFMQQTWLPRELVDADPFDF